MAGLIKGPSGVLLVLQLMWFCAIGLDMYKFWSMRNTMRIFARSPGLALVSGFAGVIIQTSIVVQEIMAQEGKVLPCAVMLYSTAVTMGLWAIPYIVRGARAVIISHKVWRTKYMVYVSRNNAYAVLGITFVFLNGICAILQQTTLQIYRENATELCFIGQDWWVWGIVVSLIIGLTARVFLELARLNDEINMAKEILRTVCVWIVTAGPYFLCMTLRSWDMLEPPRQFGFVLWVTVAMTQANTFMIEPRRRNGRTSCWKRTKIALVADEAQVAAWKKQWHDSKTIMGNAVLDQAFEKHARDYLCSESYDFLKEVDAYVAHAKESPCEEAFVHFRSIVDMYILAGAELEINIATAMRKKVLEIGDRDKFLGAFSNRQQDVFTPSKLEIAKMIDENLVHSFWRRQLFLDACKRWEEGQDTEAFTASLEDRLVAGNQEVFTAARAIASMGHQERSSNSSNHGPSTSMGLSGMSFHARTRRASITLH